MKKNNKLIVVLLTLLVTVIPKSVFAYSDYIIPGGENIGMQINSNGIMIVGTYDIDGVNPTSGSGIKIGDIITHIGEVKVNNINEMISQIDNVGNLEITITYLRDNKSYDTKIKLIKDSTGGIKTGLYVKDNISGIGTLTFIDPNSLSYGALGHEILERTSGIRMEVNFGKIYVSSVTSIDKSVKGNPGQKNASYNANDILGSVNKNTISGIFGDYTSVLPDKELKKVAEIADIKEGPAKILTVISGSNVEEFDINIIRVSTDENQETKNILFEITDEILLEKTGGVVQGMSGSPIIQGEFIIGAVTHVVIDDSKKGYGILITNMLERLEKE